MAHQLKNTQIPRTLLIKCFVNRGFETPKEDWIHANNRALGLPAIFEDGREQTNAAEGDIRKLLSTYDITEEAEHAICEWILELGQERDYYMKLTYRLQYAIALYQNVFRFFLRWIPSIGFLDRSAKKQVMQKTLS